MIFIPTGFVFVDELLKLRQFKRYSENEVRKVVDAENDKKRFALRLDPLTNRLQIRANQGVTPLRLVFLHCKRLGMLTFRKEISLDNHDTRFQFYVILLGLTI